MSVIEENFSAALLVGGFSQRMGTEKAHLDWLGNPLWKVQLEKLRALEPDHLLLSLRKEQCLEVPGVLAVFDPESSTGPLGGIQQCFKKTPGGYLLVLAVDMPSMTSAFLAEMRRGVSENRGLVFRHQGYFEPVAAIYPKAMEALQGDAKGSLQSWIQQGVDAGYLEVRDLPKEATHLFENINTPEDLDRHRRIAAINKDFGAGHE